MKGSWLTNVLLAVVAVLLAANFAVGLQRNPAKGPDDRIADSLEKIANYGVKIQDGSELVVKGPFSGHPPLKIQVVK